MFVIPPYILEGLEVNVAFRKTSERATEAFKKSDTWLNHANHMINCQVPEYAKHILEGQFRSLAARIDTHVYYLFYGRNSSALSVAISSGEAAMRLMESGMDDTTLTSLLKTADEIADQAAMTTVEEMYTGAGDGYASFVKRNAAPKTR